MRLYPYRDVCTLCHLAGRDSRCCASTALWMQSAYTRSVGYSTLRHNWNRRERSSSTAVSPGSFSDTSALLEDYVIIFPLAQNVRGPSTLFVLLIATAAPSQVFFLGRSVVPLLVIFDLHKVSSDVACDRSPAIGNPNDLTFFNR